jgi:hypothetical protein
MQASSVQEPEPAKGCCWSSRPPYDAPSLDHVQTQPLPIRPVNNLCTLNETVVANVGSVPRLACVVMADASAANAARCLCYPRRRNVPLLSLNLTGGLVAELSLYPEADRSGP